MFSVTILHNNITNLSLASSSGGRTNECIMNKKGCGGWVMKILQAALQALQALPVWPAKSQEQGVPIALIVSVSYQIRGYTCLLSIRTTHDWL